MDHFSGGLFHFKPLPVIVLFPQTQDVILNRNVVSQIGLAG